MFGFDCGTRAVEDCNAPLGTTGAVHAWTRRSWCGPCKASEVESHATLQGNGQVWRGKLGLKNVPVHPMATRSTMHWRF